MYTEEYEQKGFPIRGFILRLILVILFVLLLVWLLPKFISPSLNNNGSNNSNNSSNCKNNVCDLSGLNALTSQIFANNLEKMKDAAIAYYTSDRLPKQVGESSTMTLSEMIGKHLITPLIDKNNKAVDVDKSYVKITKMDNEYLLKVNIKDSETEDYILVHLGCYNYCDGYLCQKETKTTTTTPVKGAKDTTGYVPIIIPTPTPTPTPTPDPTIPICEYRDGKYYDIYGYRVSELNYIISCQAPKCKVVNGYYFGKDGNNVSKSTYEAECTTTPSTPKCEYKNGKYYDKNGKVVSEVDYIISCQAPKCKKVNGYYFGKDGRNVSKATYEAECKTPSTPKCEYKNGKYYDKNGKVVSEVDYLISCEAPKCKVINGYYFGKDGSNVSQATYEEECTTPEVYTCQYKNGKYYDKDGNVVSEVNYLISCLAPKCKIVNGYYFGKNGNNVNKATYEAECTTPEVYTCQYKNGKYYDKNGNVVSEVDYIISCQAPKCKVVNGYYFGKDGNNVSKSTYDLECNSQPEYIYEYIKTTAAVLSQWTPWGAWNKADCATQEINCNDQDNTCLFKLQMLKQKEQIGTYQKTYSRKRQVLKQTGSYDVKTCKNYNYVEINKKLYATTKTTTYTTVRETTTSYWVSTGSGSYSSAPSDSAGTQYVFVGADYSGCDASCTTLPNFYYEEYNYSGGMSSVGSTTSTNTYTEVTVDESERLISEDTTYEASCGGFEVKTVPIYSYITVTEKAARTEPLYGDVCYKSTKSRSVVTPATEQKTWSKFNDTSLLNAGWKYTGARTIKK